MTTPLQFGIQTFCEHWFSAAKTMLACQWKLFETQCQAGLRIAEATLGGAPANKPLARAAPEQRPNIGPPAAVDVRQLERRAAECISLGLAPPREIYKAPYRAQIDWEKFPNWARPSDPELFEGTGHEG
jgi:hypothetical protein